MMSEVQKRAQSDLQFGDDFVDFAIAHLLPPLDPLQTGAIAFPSLPHCPTYSSGKNQFVPAQTLLHLAKPFCTGIMDFVPV
jgi:hypothetical protein